MTTTQTRSERVAVIRSYMAEHPDMSRRQIAEAFRLSPANLSGMLADPDWAKQRARRSSYGHQCPNCGRTMDGSSGPSKAPKRCRTCHRQHTEPWTKERIIDAIQRYAAVHGRPPRMSDWRDPDCRPDYPPPHACGRLRRRGNVPFETWADAIEAAGFPRPSSGRTKMWTHDRILAAIRNWTNAHGEPPKMSDWNPRPEGYPSTAVVITEFGSWNGAIARAGLRPRKMRNAA